MNLALVDNNASNLSRAKETLSSSSPSSSSSTKTKTEIYTVDVTQSSQWSDLKSKIEKDFGTIDFLMLNAGIGLSWDSSKWSSEEYWRKTLETNLFGVVNGLGAFLEMVKEGASGGEKAIVMTGSKQGA